MKNHTYSDGVITVSQEERMIGSLLGTLPAEVPPMTTKQMDNVNRSRIRYGVSELVALNVEKAHEWLRQVAEGTQDADGRQVLPANPARALELFMELVQFSVPKLKSVAVDVKDKSGTMQRYTIADLQSIVAEQ